MDLLSQRAGGALGSGDVGSVVSDPEYLKEQRATLSKAHQRFDTPGLILLCVTMITWEILLSKGQEWDWFGDPFWRVQLLAVLFGTSLFALVVHETGITNPLINFRTFADR